MSILGSKKGKGWAEEYKSRVIFPSMKPLDDVQY